MKVYQETFGELRGQTVTATILAYDKGMSVTSLNYGCIITKILAPDRTGAFENVVLGFDTIEEYVDHSPYFGAVCGRFAGRIQGAEFELDGTTYTLAKNDGGNHLHGGVKGFDKVFWKSETKEEEGAVSVIYTYLSKDGEEGYPGNLQLKVTYTLNNKNELSVTYDAISDQKTLLNVTNHSYFNLSGDVKRDILGHELKLKSDQFVELNDELIPTGELLDVKGTTFDFTAGRKIQDGASSHYQQNILAGNGYDHPFLLSTNQNEEIILKDEESGRTLTVETDQPAVVVYTSNMLEGDFEIRGTEARNHLAVCLETQGLPDSIHHPHFPSSVLEKDQPYKSVTTYKFSK